MKKPICIFIISLLLSIILFSPNIIAVENDIIKPIKYEEVTSPIKNYAGGYRYNIQGWVYVYINGDPYDRGIQYGYLLADEIVDLMHRWANMIHNHPKIKPLNKFFSQEKYDKISEIWWNFCKSQCTKIYWNEYPSIPALDAA